MIRNAILGFARIASRSYPKKEIIIIWLDWLITTKSVNAEWDWCIADKDKNRILRQKLGKRIVPCVNVVKLVPKIVPNVD